MAEASAQSDRIGAALLGLGKLIKAGQFYPPDHPAFETILDETLEAFLCLPGEQGLLLKLSREGFSVEGAPVCAHLISLRKMAAVFFNRRIQSLFFLPGINAHDLREFALCLGLDGPQILARGGVQQILESKAVQGIAVNELDPSKLLLRHNTAGTAGALSAQNDSASDPQGTDSRTRAPNQKLALPSTLDELLEQLRKPFSAQRYQALLQCAPALVRKEPPEQKTAQILDLIGLLSAHSRASAFSAEMKAQARSTLEALFTPAMLRFALGKLCSGELYQDQQKKLLTALQLQEDRTFLPLMEALAEAPDPLLRSNLMELAAELCRNQEEKILKLLESEQLKLQQSAVALLGTLRSPTAVPALVALLGDGDASLHRDLIGALTKIGGQDAEKALMTLATGGAHPMQQSAILALGAMKSRTAAPLLLERLQRLRLSPAGLELARSLIRTLGQIAEPDTAAFLCRQLTKRRFWKRGLWADYRVACAVALGEIGTEEASRALEKAAHDPDPRIAAPAGRALIKLQKARST